MEIQNFNITHITCITIGLSFLEAIFGNIAHITHITRVLVFLEIQFLQYYTYYMYYHGSLFFRSEIWQYYTYYTYYIPLQTTTCPISTPQQASTLRLSLILFILRSRYSENLSWKTDNCLRLSQLG